MSSSDPSPNGDHAIIFNTTVADPELQQMEREVDMLQEGLRLKNLQETAAEDEGTRKKTVAAPAAGAAAKGAPKSIFVSGFDPRTTDADLRLFFSACGVVQRITLLKDKFTGQSKGSAYMEFETPEQAQAALLKEGQSLHGRPLKVAIKRDNIPGYHRGGGAVAAGGAAPGGFFAAPRGRGGAGANAMQQQMAAMAMLTMMSGAAAGMGFNPYPTRGRGRGRGRGGA